MPTDTSSVPAPHTQQAEPWLRGTLTDQPAELRAVLHALQLAREDIARWCGPLSEHQMHSRPHGLPPVAFHLRHIVGTLDRLLSYAEGNQLSDSQKQFLAGEMDSPGSREALLADFEHGLTAAEVRLRSIPIEAWPEARTVGRKQLPTTVAGLLIHCADHTQRHVGQAITTAKILTAGPESST